VNQDPTIAAYCENIYLNNTKIRYSTGE